MFCTTINSHFLGIICTWHDFFLGELIMSKNTQIFGLVLLVAVILTVGPFLTLFMLNTLFGLSLAYSFKTWFAALLFNVALTAKFK